MHVCKYLNQRVKRIGEQNEKSLKGFPKTKKKKKTHEETEFRNPVQDQVFTTVYRLQKSAWKYAWVGVQGG